jgi:RsiW-degrading membrane proteinase PrsW (M82 family)
MLEAIVGYFISCFSFFMSYFSSLTVLGIFLAIIFGAIWIACFWPSLIKQPWHWAIIIGGALITLLAISLIQRPLQQQLGKVINPADSETLVKWFLISALISCLVQEGAKILPVVIYWWRKKMILDPRLGLTLGAVAGAGFGILEAQMMLNLTFASGWSTDLIKMTGLEAFGPFIVNFLVIAFHTGASALAGYGLARGKGWQFYIIASLGHYFLSYSSLLQAKVLSVIQVEIYIAVLSLAILGIALWLRWRKIEKTQQPSLKSKL